METPLPHSTDSTLVELVRRRAREQPDTQLFLFLEGGERESATLTYGDLDRGASALASRIHEVCKPGERALLIYPAGLEFIVALFACLYAGVVAVTVPVPRRQWASGTLGTIVSDCKPQLVLSDSQSQPDWPSWHERCPGLASLRWMTTDGAANDATASDGMEPWSPPALGPGSLAYLQYTSGSTSRPQGVMITHGNLIANSAAAADMFGTSSDSTLVNWMPHFHDFGLVWGVIHPIYRGCRCVLIPPLAFMARPAVWLRAISRYRGTHTAAPDSAYTLCARLLSARDRAELDLTSWAVALNGAEPVRPTTLDRFTESLRGTGFEAPVFYPAYGLAEATLFVSGARRGDGPAVREVDAATLEANHARPASSDSASQTLVGSGRVAMHTDVQIVDPVTRELCQAGRVGEIWVAGPGVASGYWSKPDETEQSFGARPPGTDNGRYLRTGDLGFVDDGELFVTGRLKDLIIVRGRNFYPQDIELTAEQSHPALRPGRGAALARDAEDGERLVLVYEASPRAVRGKVEEIALTVREAVASQHELQVHELVLVKPKTVPRTSSGKIRRRPTLTAHLAGRLEVIDSWAFEPEGHSLPALDPGALRDAPAADREELLTWSLRRTVGRLLDVVPSFVDGRRPLCELGVDSLTAARVDNWLGVVTGSSPGISAVLQASVADLVAGALTAVPGDVALHTDPGLRRVDAGSHAPLSFAQQRVWFLERFAEGAPVHNLPLSVRLYGTLDLVALERALKELVRRHSALLASVQVRDGQPHLVVTEDAEVELPVVSVPPKGRRREVVRLAREMASTPFRLDRAPLFRARVLRLGPKRHTLLLTFHHLVCDGWSLGVLAREVQMLYACFAADAPQTIRPPPARYEAYAIAQQAWMQTAEADRQLRYWRERLADLPTMQLPTDRPRPRTQTFRGAEHRQTLPEGLVDGLRLLARGTGSTTYMTLLSAFQTLLHRYTGHDDVVVGTPASKRPPDHEEAIGLFVNMLIMRTDLSGSPSFREVLGRVRAGALEAYDHQDVPFEKLVEELRPVRDASRSPLCQVLFALQPVAPDVERNGSLKVVLRPLEITTSRMDLEVYCWPRTDGIDVSWVYNPDLFDGSTIGRMADHFRLLLEAVVANPDASVDEVPILTDSERARILVEWNDTERSFPADLCLHQLIEEQATSAPDAVALATSERVVTYQTLNEQANRLAHYLIAAGVGPEVTVALHLDRSVDLIVATLAVLKAGGAFVSLGPELPRGRVEFILRDAAPRVILTTSAPRESLPSGDHTVVCVDDDTPWRDAPSTNPAPELTPDTLAYVTYTSGSTGTPKGVMALHVGVTNAIVETTRFFRLGPGSRVLQFSTPTWDNFIWEIGAALCAGGQLHLASRDELAPGAPLTRLLAERAISFTILPPSILPFLDSSKLPELSTLLVGGEACPADAVPVWSIGRRFLHGYGVTEATIWTTVAEGFDGKGPPPVGRPTANTRVYVLDPSGQPVPLGVVGEVLIGGVGVARGYLNRPELTGERFLPDPFSRVPGARMYRTGDLARLRADGNLELVGRLDTQVQIRGVRVEPDEVDAVLGRHPTVRTSATVARTDGPGGPHLVAYVVAEPAALVGVSELRMHLAETLPPHMIPTAFTLLDELPLTASGKLDRTALPVPTLDPSAVHDFVAPRDALEVQLAAIWAEVLGVPEIGVHDDFFDLGGHSLLAAELVERVRKELDREIPLTAFFVAPTVARLADVIREGRVAALWTRTVPIRAGKGLKPFFAVAPILGIVFPYYDLARLMSGMHPFYGLQPVGLDGKSEPQTRMEDIAHGHVEAITALDLDGPVHLGGWSFGGLLALEVGRQLRAAGREVGTLALIDTPAPVHSQRWTVLQLARHGAALFLRHSWPYLRDYVSLRLAARRQGDALRGGGSLLSFAAMASVLSPETRAVLLRQASVGPLWRVFLASSVAQKNYVPDPYPGRVSLLRTVTGVGRTGDPLMGWDQLAEGGVETYDIPGNHMSCVRAPHVQSLARALEESL